jgi:hypothetical protein
MSDIDTRLQAAVDLLACSPPHRTRGMQRDIVLLDGGADGEFIEALLSAADQLVAPVKCAGCSDRYGQGSNSAAQIAGDPMAKAKCAGWYLPSEYNRDGDHHRCPWCNTYPTVVGKKRVNGATFFPSPSCRQVEVVASIVFAEYAHLYYGEGSTASCYMWEVEGGELNMAVLFAQRNKLDPNSGKPMGARGNKENAGGNIWTSTHVISINPKVDNPNLFSYQMHSTLYLDLAPPLAPAEEGGRDDAARCSGFVSHAGKVFSSKASVATSIPHVTIIGQHIQKFENRLRGAVGEIYFGKIAHAVAGFRGAGKKQRVMLLPSNTTASSDASPTASPNGAAAEEGESAAAPQWEEVLDDEGNVYYYNTITEASSWEAPDAPIKPLKKRKSKKDKVEDQEVVEVAPAPVEEEEEALAPGPEAEAEEEGEPEQTVEELMEALSLTGGPSPKEYAKALRKTLRVKSIWDLVALEGPEEALGEIFEAFGDRRKVLKWIKKNSAAE